MKHGRPTQWWVRWLVLAGVTAGLAACAASAHRVSAPRMVAEDGIVASIPVGEGPTLLAMSPDGARVYAASNAKLSVIGTANNDVVATIPIDPYVAGLALAPDGTRAFLTNLFSIRLTVVDTAKNAVVAPLRLFAARYRGGFGRLAVSPDGATAYVANQMNQLLAIVDLEKPSALSDKMDMRPTDIAFSADGMVAYVVGCRGFCTSGTIEVVDGASQRVRDYIAVGPRPYRILLSPDGARAYTTNLGDATVSVVDLSTKKTTATLKASVQPVGLARSLDGAHLYVTSLQGGSVTLIDTGTNEVHPPVKIARAAREIVVTPDDQRVFVSTNNRVLAVDTQALR